MAHYLVTGAAGFIASKVTEMLCAAGHTVTGIDNLNDAYDIRLKHWRLNRLRGLPGFTLIEGDIAHRPTVEGLDTALPDCAAVINLAARAGVRQSTENPWLYVDTNVTGTLNLLELCKRRGIGKFVLASTSSLYGQNNPMPYREDADTSRPISPYAATKKAAEALCYSYHALTGLDVTVFRYFTVYGPGGRPDMSLFRFVQWINEGKPVHVFGDGKQSRDFTYVDDIAKGTILGLKPLGYQTINLGSDRPVVLMEMVHILEELLGKTAQVDYQPRHPADITASWADISRARELLGWQPQTDYLQGLRNLVDWYRENQAWAKDVRTE
ncbi:MAG TPA: GDP-mannose 4,6-dehydratase [Aggregatilineales bacterium]|nr:GDP-mannose 4,6-dehydratase [Anaerolineales bacterium]HRE47870.1 GDP-mannose 4,6-dehydratase [Aggregatilineales bacterium]